MEINGNNAPKMQGKEAYKVESIPPQQVNGTLHVVMGPDGIPLTQEQINQLPPNAKAAIGQVPNLGNGQIPPIPDVVGKAPEVAANDDIVNGIIGSGAEEAKAALAGLPWMQRLAVRKALHSQLDGRKWWQLHEVNLLDQSDVAPVLLGVLAGFGLTVLAITIRNAMKSE